MGTTHWKKPTSGAWEDSANWSKGLPGRHDVAQIIADGDYTVTLSSKQKVAELDVSHATLIEEKGAALTTGKIVLDQATLQLDVANPHLGGEIDVTASTIEIGHEGALGTAAVTLGSGAVLESSITATITGEIELDPQEQGDIAPVIMAATGTTLTMAGQLNIHGEVLLDADNQARIAINGNIIGSGVILEVTGGGTIEIAADETFFGFYYVNSGTLLIDDGVFLGGNSIELGGHWHCVARGHCTTR